MVVVTHALCAATAGVHVHCLLAGLGGGVAAAGAKRTRRSSAKVAGASFINFFVAL